jgi:hypothetical protein
VRAGGLTSASAGRFDGRPSSEPRARGAIQEHWILSVDMKTEGKRLTKLLGGKTVRHIRKFRPQEIMVEFTDGARLYVDCPSEAVECSVTLEDSN